MAEDRTQTLFLKLKNSCVPLLAHSLLTPSSSVIASRCLSEIINVLQQNRKSLTAPIISYVFFPLSTILRRNPPSAIPDHVFEKTLIIIGIICDVWWWDCDIKVWEQLLMLCGTVLGDITDTKEHPKRRDSETKAAAAQCLLTLIRQRTEEERPPGTSTSPQERLSVYRLHAQSARLVPIVGQILASVLTTLSESSDIRLENLLLEVLAYLVRDYLDDDLIPSVLPGIVSHTSKAAIGTGTGKGWVKGETVGLALHVLEAAIVRSISDEICLREGIIDDPNQLEDLARPTPDAAAQSSNHTQTRAASARSRVWLQGTCSQLHIALNTLTPLLAHPTPSALRQLACFSYVVVSSTTLSLPQSRPLLLSYLLSLSTNVFESVAASARDGLSKLLRPAFRARHLMLQSLAAIVRDNFENLPRLLASTSDRKVEHAARIIEAICLLATSTDESSSPITKSAPSLFRAVGGIEKWGWSLVSVLELSIPDVVIDQAPTAPPLLETESEHPTETAFPFPHVKVDNLSSRDTQVVLENMIRALGRTLGDDCLTTVEWFVEVGRRGVNDPRSVAALWFASKLMDGVSGFALSSECHQQMGKRAPSKRLRRFARSLTKSLAGFWEQNVALPQDQPTAPLENEDTQNLLLEHRRGFSLVIGPPGSTLGPGPFKKAFASPWLRDGICLQLLAISAGILQSRFTSLLMDAMYPMLHSLVSRASFLSSTALACLNSISHNMSYARPANLLLSNFDYALDAVSRRLSYRWLDVEAPKVLAVLIRLVGRDVVHKASDVVNECFDRLDELHGYSMIVEGLMEVLNEVLGAIDAKDVSSTQNFASSPSLPTDQVCFDNLVEWLASKGHPKVVDDDSDASNPLSTRSPSTTSWEESKPGEHSGDPDTEPPRTPTQVLIEQIVSRSLYFLTHGSAVIRAHVLRLLESAVPLLPESALLPSIHHSWPFIVNRFTDQEPFVVSAAASLLESLATHAGDFMSRRIWDEVWPLFRAMLAKLDAVDAQNALFKRSGAFHNPISAYTHSHRTYRAILKTMIAAAMGVRPRETSTWEVIIAFRRFLDARIHDELQHYARRLYIQLGKSNGDAVWVALHATQGTVGNSLAFLKEEWVIGQNVDIIVDALNNT
ncbi:hypothetical protein PUNSTDRAFT_110095 [Punctularia strigosozonata HHB-11173 SS5]|uniref:uncharacterized protein n=1 Tax=Punctularia strigosozonata (strain HHB-11173) TaxID=741275 RepID=UPI00044186D5|nr:uncharacterized protein PUNSTDRAFT_110095 [Punctularia strigosozonata HHB-11173 SS5]EIN13941.1 hypothetical protein PUNSTDRAFT_110095 [Punctularia strigosozonata HHB-11173 SS5]